MPVARERSANPTFQLQQRTTASWQFPQCSVNDLELRRKHHDVVCLQLNALFCELALCHWDKEQCAICPRGANLAASILHPCNTSLEVLGRKEVVEDSWAVEGETCQN